MRLEGAREGSAVWRARPRPRTVTLPVSRCPWPSRSDLATGRPAVGCWFGRSKARRGGAVPLRARSGGAGSLLRAVERRPRFLAGGPWKRPWFPHPSLASGQLTAWQLVSRGVC